MIWTRRPVLAVALLIGVAMLRIASTYTVFSATTDEPVHLGAGLELLQQHTYTLQPENPPLPRLIFAVFPKMAGLHWGTSPDFYQNAHELLYTGDRYLTKLVLIRIGNLLFFVISAIALFAWTRLELGASEAVIATLLFTMQPIVLGYSGIANHDAAATAGVAVSLLAFGRWLRKPKVMRTAVLGAAYGFSILCKFSCIPYVPAACAAIYAVRIIRDPELRSPRVLLRVLFVPVVAFAVIWAGYGFTIGPFASLIVPAPAFFSGIKGLISIDRGGFQSYAFGMKTVRGWWWYFPAAVALKTTLPFLVLVIGGGWFAWRAPRLRWTFVESLLAALAILAIAMPSTLDLGVRYVLPLYVPLTLAATAAAAALLENARKEIRSAAIALIALHVVVSLAAHPDYFPYFNALAGDEPGWCLVDSNLDWGQDALRLKAAAKRLRIDRIGILVPGSIDYDAIGLPRSYPLDPYRPQRGWVAVGEHFYRSQRTDKGWWWLEPYRVTHAGKSIRLYYVPECEPQLVEPAEPLAQERILLPIAGTNAPWGPTHGAQWSVDQTLLNQGKKVAHVSLSNCTRVRVVLRREVPSCDFNLRPGQSMRIAGSDPIRPFIWVSVPHEVAGDLKLSTVVRRVDRQVPGSEVKVPAVHESEFRSGSIAIDDVPFSPRKRVNLRLYTAASGLSAPATVRVESGAKVLAQKAVTIYATGFYTHGDIAKLFPELAGRDLKATITIDANARLWAFVTVTDARTGEETITVPRK